MYNNFLNIFLLFKKKTKLSKNWIDCSTWNNKSGLLGASNPKFSVAQLEQVSVISFFSLKASLPLIDLAKSLPVLSHQWELELSKGDMHDCWWHKAQRSIAVRYNIIE